VNNDFIDTIEEKMAVNLGIVRELVESASLAGVLTRSDTRPVCSLYDLPMDWRIEYEERAAILEYDGGLSRENADMQALEEILERMKNTD